MPDAAAIIPSVLPGASSGCETVDQIVHWGEVQEGDLVLFEGQMHQLERMWPFGLKGSQVGVRLLREGRLQDRLVDSNALAAVRRYVTTEG